MAAILIIVLNFLHNVVILVIGKLKITCSRNIDKERFQVPRSEAEAFFVNLVKEILKWERSFKSARPFTQLKLNLFIQFILLGSLEIDGVSKDVILVVDIEHVLKSLVTFKNLVFKGTSALQHGACSRLDYCIWDQICYIRELRIIFCLCQRCIL